MHGSKVQKVLSVNLPLWDGNLFIDTTCGVQIIGVAGRLVVDAAARSSVFPCSLFAFYVFILEWRQEMRHAPLATPSSRRFSAFYYVSLVPTTSR